MGETYRSIPVNLTDRLPIDGEKKVNIQECRTTDETRKNRSTKHRKRTLLIRRAIKANTTL